MMPKRPSGNARLTSHSAGTSLATHLELFGPLDVNWQPGTPDAALRDLTTRSGLRGRGGGWFPTGRKMDALVDGGSDKPPCLVANAMESEPASHSDAWLLSANPHLVFDGMQIAAQSIGARRATLAIHEGHSAESVVREALADRNADAVPIDLAILKSHYVSSEESALAQGVGGDLAIPVYGLRPHEYGVDGNPTMVNNAETLAHLALIARWGADWFREVGTPDAPGTALLSAGGAFVQPGVYEAPLGEASTNVVEIAGGLVDVPIAFLIGGYGGHWVSAEEFLSTSWDPEDLRVRGLNLGAGVLWALPAENCGLIGTARIATYMAGESAGQCGPCRFGLSELADRLTQLALRRDVADNLQAVEALLPLVTRRGGCAHPDGVARLIGSAIDVFAEEIAEHAAGRCMSADDPEVTFPIPEVRERPAPLPDRSWRPITTGSR